MFVCFGVSVRMGNSLEQHRQVIGGFYSKACKRKKSRANYWEPWEDELDSWQVNFCNTDQLVSISWIWKHIMEIWPFGRWALRGSSSLWWCSEPSRWPLSASSTWCCWQCLELKQILTQVPSQQLETLWNGSTVECSSSALVLWRAPDGANDAQFMRWNL